MGRTMNLSNPQGPEWTYNVDKGYVDDVYAHEFNTIQAAIDCAYSEHGVITDYKVKPLIIVHPGTYTEQIHSYLGYVVYGYTLDPSAEYKTVSLENTGADAEHYPLRGDNGDHYNIEGITISTDEGGAIGKLSLSFFYHCVFRRGHFIESTDNKNVYMALEDCAFRYQSKAFDLTGAGTGGNRTIQINKTHFSEATNHWITTSTHGVDTASFFIGECTFKKHFPDIKGDWNIQIENSHVFGSDKTVFDTAGEIAYLQCNTSNGFHFISNPAKAMFYGCNYNDNEGYDITGMDVTADVIITDVNYVGNIQQNGICGNIQIIGNSRNIGGESEDRYYCLQCAIDSIPTSEDGVVNIFETYNDHDPLTITGYKSIVINGQYTFELNFTGNIASLGDGQEITFLNMAYVRGHTFEINGAGAGLIIENCLTTRFNIIQTSGIGALVVIYGSTHYGRPDHPAIQVDSTAPLTVLAYSLVEGGSDGGGTVTAYPAVLFNIDADNTLKGKYSTFIHGANSTTPPIQRVGVYTTLVSLYMCAGNGLLTPAGIGNTITGSGNVNDSSIDF